MTIKTDMINFWCKRIFNIFTLVIPMVLVGQFSEKTIETDSSTIKMIKNSKFIVIEERLKNSTSTKWKSFYVKDSTISSEGLFAVGREKTGKWKKYTRNGQLLSIIDYDNQSWIRMIPDAFPYRILLDSIKAKGDSLIISVYSQLFFDRHVRWNIDFSYAKRISEMKPDNPYCFFGLQGRWTDPAISKPISFKLRYDVLFDSTHIRENAIEFEFDSTGQLILDMHNQILGFENLSNDSPKYFLLTYENAVKQARLHGLVETDSSHISGFLDWESYRKPQFYNGNYKFHVVQRYKSENEETDSEGIYKIYDYYNVWKFNPWTGKFIEKEHIVDNYEWNGPEGFWRDAN